MQQTFSTVAGAELPVEECDFSGRQLTLVGGPHAGQKVEVVGIVPGRTIPLLAVCLAGRNLAINPAWLVNVTSLAVLE